ncbi:MAG: Coq4 family protein [Caulobacteraceae bacterium]
MSLAHSLSETLATAVSSPMRRATAKPVHKYAIEPRRAWTAFRRLIADKEDTRQVFEIMRALAGQSIPKGYARMLKTTEGGRQAFLAEEFADRLQDDAWLASLPEGSVGAAYRAFIAPRGLSAYGLAEESRKLPDVEIDTPHPVAWYARRLRDVHDVWHVLTGYGTDALGEVCVVAFSYAQTRTLGFALIAGGGALELQRGGSGWPYGKAVAQAYANGRRAEWLAPLDYEALFLEPLEAARARLGIRPPTTYQSIPAEHRDGALGPIKLAA